MRLFALLSFLVPFASSFGCTSSTSTVTTDDDPRGVTSSRLADGWTRGVTNDLSSRRPGYAARYALGTHVRFDAFDTATGPTTCSTAETSGCNGPGCSTPTAATNSAVASVVCEGGCTATVARRAAGRFAVDALATTAGVKTVTLRLADESGLVLATTATFEVARATEVRVTRGFVESPHGTAYAALPGAGFGWCSALADADGALAFDGARLVVAILGGARVPNAVDALDPDDPLGANAVDHRCDRFLAVEPGTLTFTATHRDVQWTASVPVLAPEAIVRAELVAFPTQLTADSIERALAVTDDPLAGAPPVDRVVLPDAQGGASFLVRGFTREGLPALAPLARPAVLPESLATISTGLVLAVTARAPGSGVLRGAAGAASLEVPLDVLPLPIADAGADADDAGGADGGVDAEP